ncbi:MAG: hypothetical protein ACTHY6_12325, partial [Corynebacterium variabile]
MKLARQPYHRRLKTPITGSEVVQAYRANALFDAHKDNRRVRTLAPRTTKPVRPVSRWPIELR